MVDAAEAEPVAHLRLAALSIGKNVGGVEEAHLLKPTDRTLVVVRGQNAAAEACLVDPDLHLARGVPALDRVVGKVRVALLEASDHLALGHEHLPCGWCVLYDEAGVERAIPAWPRSDEVADRHSQVVRC